MKLLTTGFGLACTRNSNATAQHIAFAIWAERLGRVPTSREIADRYGCDMETARRWCRWFAAAAGYPKPAFRRGRPQGATA